MTELGELRFRFCVLGQTFSLDPCVNAYRTVLLEIALTCTYWFVVQLGPLMTVFLNYHFRVRLESGTTENGKNTALGTVVIRNEAV